MISEWMKVMLEEIARKQGGCGAGANRAARRRREEEPAAHPADRWRPRTARKARRLC
jgi:hypothetical protein